MVNLRRTEEKLEQENGHIYHIIKEHKAAAAAMAEHYHQAAQLKMVSRAEDENQNVNHVNTNHVLNQFLFEGEEQPSGMLQLSPLQPGGHNFYGPFRLFPTQTNLQDYFLN